MTIDYNHSANGHSINGPEAALPSLLGSDRPSSILDVGCGLGTWLRAAQQLGITDVFGIDGVDIAEDALLVTREVFAHHDLSKPLNMGRRFDVLLCLEVAEHLDPEAGDILITSLTQHADKIFFSAAAPGQPGQHHVNCQWPSYWQDRFNALGFACDDEPRWKIWTDSRIEVWYRQNMFCARREQQIAGTEPRIRSVLHPEFLPQLNQINYGGMSASWHLRTGCVALCSKILRKISRGRKLSVS